MLVHIDIEKELTTCLRSMGALVSDDRKAPDKDSNSDFWFASDRVAAELKILSKNYFADVTYQDWLNRAYHGWVIRGLAPRVYRNNTAVNLADLNPQCYKEVESYIKKKLERSFKKASKQTQATRLLHDAKEGTGLLLLVNDGNYGIVPAMIQNIVARSLSKYSGINTVIYFSANMPMRSTETSMDVLPWCTWSKSSTRPPVARDLLDRIKSTWLAHIGAVVGETIHEIPSTKESLAGMEYLKR